MRAAATRFFFEPRADGVYRTWRRIDGVIFSWLPLWDFFFWPSMSREIFIFAAEGSDLYDVQKKTDNFRVGDNFLCVYSVCVIESVLGQWDSGISNE